MKKSFYLSSLLIALFLFSNTSFALYAENSVTFGNLKETFSSYTGTALSEETTYSDTQKLTKYQILTILFENLGITTPLIVDAENFPFTDINSTSEVAKTAYKAYELGILETDDSTLFRMSKRISPEELTDYLNKMSSYIPTLGQLSQKAYDPTTILSEKTYTHSQEELLVSDKFAIFLDIWENLKNNFYYKDELNDDELINAAITGMVEEAGDIYTVYQDSALAGQFLDSLSGEYEGIGLTIDSIGNDITVISPFKDSPAEAAGLKPNDIIIEIGGESMLEATVEYAASKIKGEAGTDVKIKVLRDDTELEFTITREKITYISVSYEVKKEGKKEIGYINMTSFTWTGYEDFKAAVDTLIEENPGIDGFIIDLRNNPGGYMDPAINIIGLFTEELKTAVQLEYADGSLEKYETMGWATLENYETVVLINEGSASSSEILASALQDYDLATLVGETSFGKGSAQQISTYEDGSLFKFTVAKWLTPLGNDIDQVGITPDIVITDKPETTKDEQLEKALDQF